MNTQPSKSDQLERRFITFGVSILSLSQKLPRKPQGRHICSQILRSGTATAANYAEARGAESRADFIHKLRIVFKRTKRNDGLARNDCRRLVPSFVRGFPDSRGKPGTLSRYRRINPDRDEFRILLIYSPPTYRRCS